MLSLFTQTASRYNSFLPVLSAGFFSMGFIWLKSYQLMASAHRAVVATLIYVKVIILA